MIPIVFFFSCTEDRKTSQQQKKAEIPKALQESNSVMESYKRSYDKDLIEELYAEMIEKNPKLKNLEEAIAENQKILNKASSDFNSYHSKSENYYRQANTKIESISDSTLKKNILRIIQKNEEAYTAKINTFNRLISLINTKLTSIHNHHTALKILLTLQQIEKYQNDYLPEDKDYKEVNKKLTQIIIQLDSLATQK